MENIQWMSDADILLHLGNKIKEWRLQMTICGKRNNITKEDLVKFAQKQDVLHPEEIIDTVYSAIMKFPEYARATSVKEEEITRIICTFERFNNGL